MVQEFVFKAFIGEFSISLDPLYPRGQLIGR